MTTTQNDKAREALIPASIHGGFVAFHNRCPLCADNIIMNKHAVECAGSGCGYTLRRTTREDLQMWEALKTEALATKPTAPAADERYSTGTKQESAIPAADAQTVVDGLFAEDIRLATEILHKLCHGKHKWKMSIPVQADDSDQILYRVLQVASRANPSPTEEANEPGWNETGIADPAIWDDKKPAPSQPAKDVVEALDKLIVVVMEDAVRQCSPTAGGHSRDPDVVAINRAREAVLAAMPDHGAAYDMREEIAALKELHAKSPHVMDWQTRDGFTIPVLNIVMELHRQHGGALARIAELETLINIAASAVDAAMCRPNDLSNRLRRSLANHVNFSEPPDRGEVDDLEAKPAVTMGITEEEAENIIQKTAVICEHRVEGGWKHRIMNPREVYRALLPYLSHGQAAGDGK